MAEVKRLTSNDQSDPEQIRRLTTSDYLEAAQCMAEAFETDVLSRYFVDTPDRPHWTEAQRWAIHLSIMQYITYAHCMKGIVTTVGPDNASVALWMPPGANMDDMRTVVLSGLWRLHYKLSPVGRARFFAEFFPLLHDTKAAVLGQRDSDAYYLVYIGTRPAGRGRGYARRLIDDMLARADAERRPIYLESTSSLNVPLYVRCGFERVSSIALADGAVPLDIMVREPRKFDGIKITARADSGVEMADGTEPSDQHRNARGADKAGAVAGRRDSKSIRSFAALLRGRFASSAAA